MEHNSIRFSKHTNFYDGRQGGSYTVKYGYLVDLRKALLISLTVASKKLTHFRDTIQDNPNKPVVDQSNISALYSVPPATAECKQICLPLHFIIFHLLIFSFCTPLTLPHSIFDIALHLLLLFIEAKS